MLSAANHTVTRAFLKLTTMLLLMAGGMGAAFASNTGAAPQLIPYQANSLAGNTTYGIGSQVSGFGGDGAPGSAATLSGPGVVAVDSVGNVYIVDAGNDLIREINAQTGVISIVAGVKPTGCIGTVCHSVPGCSDAVQAAGNPIGSGIQGIAVDAYGNLYFSDATTSTVSVVYRGGSQVMNFIKLVNPTGVAASNGVQLGYVYHIAGSISLATCAGAPTKTASTTQVAVPAGDGQLAYNGGGSAVTVTFGNVQALGLDSAGNLYIGDGSPNSVIRVVNTQAQAQTFFGLSVQPGFIQSIVNCGPLTTLCPAGGGNTPITQQNSGLGGPPEGAVFNTLATGNGAWMSVDAYGNIYELNTKGATPGIYNGVAYAGGPYLGPMLNQSLISLNIPGVATATPGNFYWLFPGLRPSSVAADAAGNVYFLDNHYGQIYRFDRNAVAYASNFIEETSLFVGGNVGASNRSNPGTVAAPAFCYPASLAVPVTNPVLTDAYITTDPYGDGCPADLANGVGVPHSGNGYGTAIADGPGNLIIADRTNNAARQVSLDTRFPSTTVAKPKQQGVQVHFDQTNLPVINNLTGGAVNTTSIVMGTGIPDFTINPTSTEWTQSTGSGIGIGQSTVTSTSVTGAVTPPLCANNTGSVDASLDCVVNVVFTPTAPGVRQSQLVVTTKNGSLYRFGLTGIGSGPQLAIDGGAQAVVSAAGLGNPGQVSVDQYGTVYTADAANNRIVVQASGGAGAQTAIGPAMSLPSTSAPNSLSGPMGVAVDASSNIYISDTGNNRVIEINQNAGTQTVIGQIVATGTPAYKQYAFKGPQGLTVDVNGNVYVADTGNSVVVEIPSNPVLGGATPLLQYPGAPALKNPVAVAVDANGNLYIADTKNFQILEVPAGGGDLHTLPGATLASFGVLNSPSGVAVDGAGNVYASDSGTNTVYEIPSASGPGGEQVALSFSGLKLTGATSVGGSIAMDSNGNLYVADTGNSRVLFMNRQNPTVAYGTLAQDQPASTAVLFATNIGNQSLTIGSSFDAISSASPSGNNAFTLPANPSLSSQTPGNLCAPGVTLAAGLHCTFAASFLPTTDGAQSATVALNGGSQTVTLTGNGEQPLVKIVLSVTAPTGGAVVGQPATITATVTQPNIPGDIPLGPIVFTYTDSCSTDTGGTATVQLVASGPGTSTASFTLPALLQGRQYTINATYTDDALNSPTVATPLVIYIPGIPETVTAASAAFTYGTKPPALTGTVTPAPAAPVTYSFTTLATATTPIGVYPVTVVFAGAGSCNYGLPVAYNTGTTTPATVTENPAALTVAANNASTVYGAPNLTFTSSVTGAVNGDQFSEKYVATGTGLPAAGQPQSQLLPVGTFTLVPTLQGNAVGNYTVTVTNGKVTVTTAPSVITVAPTATSVLSTNLAADPINISVSTGVTAGAGTPTGSVTLTDLFTPINATAPGGGAEILVAGQSCPVATTSTAINSTTTSTTIGPLALVAGTVIYTPTSTAVGTHIYCVSYSGDSNFQTSTTLTATNLTVDTPDFIVISTTNPIQIAPGVLPGGNAAISGEAAATPEQATVTISSVLSLTGTVYLGCQPQSPSYVTCSFFPPTVTLPSPASGTTTASVSSILSIQTPATLPLNFNFGSELRKPASQTVLAFLPLGLLAICFRRRKRLSKVLWMLLAIAGMSAGLNGCGNNSVHYFTPVPSGAQIVTVYACSIQSSCTTANPVSSPLTGTGPGTIRSFTVSINIQ